MAIGTWLINDATLDSLRIERASLRLANRGEDSLSLVLAKNPGWSYGQSIVVKRNGAGFWRGTVSQPAKLVSRVSPRWVIAIRNGWNDLAERIFENEVTHWNPTAGEGGAGASEAVSVPEAFLGQDSDGSHLTTGEVIAQAVAWAQGRGDAISAGTIFDGRLAPQTLASEVSCLDVIRKMLAYHPDAVAWIEGTALHVKAPADLDTVTLDLTGADELVTYQIVDRSDLVPTGFKLVWKKLVTEDGVPRTYYHIETKGTLTGKPAAAVTMIELAGAAITNEKVDIGTRTLPDPASLTAARAKRFYKALLPYLQGEDDDDIAIDNQHLAIIDQGDDEWSYADDDIATNGEASVGVPSAVLALSESALQAAYPRMLVKGQIQPWMTVDAYLARLTARIAYKGDNPDVIRAMGGQRLYSPTAAGFYTAINLDEAITITDAFPRVYEKVAAFDQGASPLSGLADDYWAAINRQRIEGSLDGPLWANTKLPTLRPGKKVQISGEMAAAVPIEEATFDLVGDRGAWRFGVADHLSAGDLYELSQVGNVNPASWFNEDERTTGARSIAKTISDQSPVENRAAIPKAGGLALDPWGIDVYQVSGVTKWRVKPGYLRESSDYDRAAGGVTLSGLTDERSIPSAGQVLYVRFAYDNETGERTSATVTLGSEWSDWPSPWVFDEIGETGFDGMTDYYWLLYSFSNAADVDAGDPAVIPLGSGIVAVRCVPVAHTFHLVNQTYVPTTGSRRPVVIAVPGSGAAY